jgi:ferric-dicitrate binding protein FerR (iron transport regulator)
MQTSDSSERKWHLAAKILTSGLDPDETLEWNQYLDDPQFKLEFDGVKKNWDAFGTLPYQQINVQRDWSQVQRRIGAGTSKNNWAPAFLRYAAVILFAMGVAYYIGQRQTDDYKSRLTVIEAPAGTRTAVTLPDSSKVWLNAHSQISFDAGFGATNRNITLQGEAFFDVVKEETPFSIHTTSYDITVLGTAFNIKAYADDDEAVTTLVRGSLRIERTTESGKREQVIMKPNEKVSLANDHGAVFIVKRDIDAESEVAWKDGWLSVRGESLNELARKIERLYDVKVDFQDQGLQRYRYTGRIRLLSLEQVLKALSLTSPVEFSIDEKTVILRENKKEKQNYQSLQAP